jgi:AraC-like DNA-binding protein
LTDTERSRDIAAEEARANKTTTPAGEPGLVGRLDRRQLHLRVAAISIRDVLKEAERLSFSPQTLCHGMEFCVEDLEAPGCMILHREAALVIRRTTQQIGNPKLGLELGMRSNLASAGALSLGVMASRALGEAIALAQCYPSSAGFLLARQTELLGERHVLTADPLSGDIDLAPFLADRMFAGLTYAYRQLTQANYAPLAIEFVRERPLSARDYELYFQCPVRFGCERNRMVSDAKWLDYPLPTADAMSFRLAKQLLEQQVVADGMTSELLGAVAQLIRGGLPNPPTPTVLASSLNLSERSLRRRLTEAGQSYQAMLDSCLKAHALELLKNGRLPLAKVATQCGFADERGFRRAFQRWTGHTPSAARSDISVK